MSKTKYIARLNGETVGTRSSDRVYTNAVVIQRSEAAARKAAYEYRSTTSDSSNFEYISIIAQGRSPYDFNKTEKATSDAKAQVEGGFDAYVRRLRERAIASFERYLADGHFTPVAATWCGRPNLAQKEAAKYRSAVNIENVWIVEAETA